ncbi:MAG: hypothetical protein V1816_16515 [Pseudomonadota bacterium]
MVGRFSPVAAIVLILFLASCGGPWRHHEKGEKELIQDKADCEQTAVISAREQSLTGKRVLYGPYERVFEFCMNHKGWTRGRPDGDAAPAEIKAPAPLAKQTGENTFVFSGETIILPQGSQVVRQWTKKVGPSTAEIVKFQLDRGGKPFNGEMIFQASDSMAGFEDLVYPISPPFFTYSTGVLRNGSRWRAFLGNTPDGSWMGAVGTYWKVSRTERVLLTFSTDIPPLADDSPPPPGLKTTPAQNLAMETIVKEFLPWLDEQGSPYFSIFDFLRWNFDQIEIAPQ